MSNTSIKPEDILDTQALESLRWAYDCEAMYAIVSRSFLNHAGAKQAVQTVLDVNYRNSSLHPKDRERVIIALMSAEEADWTLAIHIYWGLMEGLTYDDVIQSLLLTAAYRGMDKFVKAGMLFTRTLETLRTIVEDNPKDLFVTRVVPELLNEMRA